MADSLHLLGVLAHQVGRDDVAVELIRKAIASDRRPAAFHSNWARLIRRWAMEEAATSYERALILIRNWPRRRWNLGAVREAQGKHEQAEMRFGGR